MSGTLILKNGLMAAACVAGLTLTACASGQTSNSSRYGSVYDYESGGSGGCDAGPCGAVVAPAYTGYTGGQMIGGQPVSPGVVYADCSVVSGMNCNTGGQSVSVYSPPATTYTDNTISCPSTTVTTNSNTCVTAGSGYSSTTSTSTYTGEAVACPAGTTAAGDGTCMETGGGYSFTDTTTYTGSTTYSGGTVNCPAGTTAAGDGTCMESSSGYTGYTAPTTYVAPTTYLPIRK